MPKPANKYNVYLTHPESGEKFLIYANIAPKDFASKMGLNKHIVYKMILKSGPHPWNIMCDKIFHFELLPREIKNKKNNSELNSEGVQTQIQMR